MLGRGFSLEATRPTAADIDAVAATVGREQPLYLSAVPAQSFAQQADLAAQVRRVGLEPVPHLPARRFASVAELSDVLARLRGEADVRRVLVIAGDGDAAGPFADALALIRSGALQKSGIEEIGVSGYPEPHPRIPAPKIDAALRDKIAAAADAGLRLHIVSQFSFDPAAITAWLRRLRADGVTAPVKVGMAGPAGLTALLRYAKRCGVGASLRGLMSGAAAGLVGGLTGQVGPDRIIDALADAEDLGDIEPHYFSFSGVVETARYAHAKAAELSAGQAARRADKSHAMTGSN
jgi:methylenetetrahydrofolate reductase (NADPH)